MRLEHLSTDWNRLWRQARQHDGLMHGLRALAALVAVLGLAWVRDWSWQVMPVLLGVVASALTETDDPWRGRLRMQLCTLAVFGLLAAVVGAVLPWPLALTAATAVGAVVLTLAGALGERWRALGFGALVFGLYVALSAQSSRRPAGELTPLLLGGAAWYGLVSVLWSAAVARAPVRQRLAQVYALLGEYLQLKSRLLEPIRDADIAQRRMALALYNGLVVDALGAARDALFCRLRGRRAPPAWLQDALHQYLSAQDIHERTSSSHEDYARLADAFFRSDALYRCQRVLGLQGQQCLKLSLAIGRRQPLRHQGATARAIEDMHGAIALQLSGSGIGAGPGADPGGDDGAGRDGDPGRHTRAGIPPAARALQALQGLGTNLTEQATVLARVLPMDAASAPAGTSGVAGATPQTGGDRSLVDTEPRSWAEARARIRAQCHLRSPLLRHGLRLALALCAGFALMTATADPHGYWTLLTIVFVSQPHYAATLKRLGQRLTGTLVGLAVGWALVRLFPDDLAGSVLTALSGALFLGTRRSHYALATGAITTLLLLAFHQLGMSDGVISGRLLDTLAGGGIAALAAWLVLPNWQARQWPALAAATLRAQAHYLDQVLAQVAGGTPDARPAARQDHLDYRIARRNAHVADAALANALAAMLKEPARVRLDTGACGAFLIASHTLLNYLSALGAHRGEAV
ncbi:MAG: family rane protein, partial [Pseudomonadota bacterium]